MEDNLTTPSLKRAIREDAHDGYRPAFIARRRGVDEQTVLAVLHPNRRASGESLTRMTAFRWLREAKLERHPVVRAWRVRAVKANWCDLVPEWREEI